MLDVVTKLSVIEFDILNEDLDLFTRCFKNIIGLKRKQYRKIEALIEKDSILNISDNMHLLLLIKNKIIHFITSNCLNVIEICKNFLNNITKSGNNSKFKKAKLYFQKNIGDHFRYLFELSCNNEFKEKAKEAYKDALSTAEGEKFSPTDMTYLTFFLNYSVFLHDIMEDGIEAERRAKAILHAALKETEEITENHQKDIILLCQVIKDNLSLWKNEMPDELKY